MLKAQPRYDYGWVSEELCKTKSLVVPTSLIYVHDNIVDMKCSDL